MTAPVTISPRTPGYKALMNTLIGARTVQAATFSARVATTIAAQQDTANAGSKAGA